MENIMFEKDNTTLSNTRNGFIKTIGLSIFTHKGITTLAPINSKGNIAQSSIEIPCNKSPIDALDALLKKKDLLPLLIGIHPLLDTLITEKLRK